MSYLVFARKYRPQTFDQVIGQEHITRTLVNAISSNRVAHAIIFSGPRGTGKTTVARILAKAVNCKNGPTPTPCNQCRSCREIFSGNSVDVFEIDGASNNSVDQIRELRENAKYMPAHSPYKIYIIDEVHMLSIAAFNALLKTLEEPPSHIMFMFATTEPHKIPVTILSRCQRHDFRRIGIEAIQGHLKTICGKEGVKATEQSLYLIAREAGGSMRDALSLLDQIVACTESSFDEDDVIGLLGVTDRKIIFEFLHAVLTGNVTEVLEILDRAHDRGFDMKKLYADLVEQFRNMLVTKLEQKTRKLVNLPDHEIDQLRHLVRDVSAAHLNQLFDLVLSEEAAVRFSSQPKLVMEMVFLRTCQIKPTLPVDVLIQKLEDLRVELSGREKETEEPGGYDLCGKVDSHKKSSDSSGSATVGSEKKTDLNANLGALWKKAVEIASDNHPMLAAVLAKCSLGTLTEQGLEIVVNGGDFNMNLIKRPKNRGVLEKIIRDLLGKRVELLFKMRNEQSHNNHRRREYEERLKKEALSHPLVAETLEVFNGKVVDVKIL